MAHHKSFSEFFCNCGKSWKSVNTYPDKKQICFNCKRWIFSAYQQPLKSEQMNRWDNCETKTPYQGRHRAYGWFNCSHCGKEWSSHNSWANMGQVCYSCGIMIYPYRQVMPKHGRGHPKTPHFEEYCEMCQDLTYNCEYYDPGTDYRYQDTNADSDDNASDYNDADSYY